MTQKAASLLNWYDRHRRVLPWRALPGQKADPYAVWLSEIMLQQTTVQTVIPYYKRFLDYFPCIKDLANAPQETVLQLWAGLGYYARARNLYACAQVVAKHGHFPDTVEDLIKLPGIGNYTARAIAAIAFNRPVVPVDGNVERITARLYAITTPLPEARPLLTKQAASLNQDKEAQARPSDFAQALFDLGATLCTPRSPSCLTCPLDENCQGYAKGIATILPQRAPKKAKPARYGAVFQLTNAEGKVLLRKRPPRGLLGGMDELPGTEWRNTEWTEEEALSHAPVSLIWEKYGEIRHIFTHFTLYLKVYKAYLPKCHDDQIKSTFGVFQSTRKAALPGLMRKCLLINRVPDLSADKDTP